MIEIWWPFECTEVSVKLKKEVDLSLVSCYPARKKWWHCGHKGMHMVSNDTQVGGGILRDDTGRLNSPLN